MWRPQGLHFFSAEMCYNLDMPSILFENGYRFFFFSNEGNPLEPCHVHVRKHGALAKYWVGDRPILADNIGFTAKELKEIESIISSNTILLEEAWNEFFTN